MSSETSQIRGRIGDLDVVWKKAPRGSAGSGFVQIGGKGAPFTEVRWKKDDHGLWIELPNGLYGFDFEGECQEDGTLTYTVSQRGTALEWKDVAFLRSGESIASGIGYESKKGVRVRAQMPGKIIRILAKETRQVEKDQPLCVMEAMKMENEIRSPRAGTVKQIKIVEGQAVETGADLFVIDPL